MQQPHRESQVEIPSDEIEAKEVSHDHASLAGKAAFYHSQKFDSLSRLKNDSPGETDRLCKVRWSDLQVGDLLGTGAFSHVREARIVGPCSCHPECRSACVRGGKYAIKTLKKSIKKERVTFEIGAIGLANEAKLLALINHENTIKLHGISQKCLSEAYLHKNDYFLVLERLDYTLDDLLKRLRIREQSNKAASNIMKRLCFRGGDPSLIATQKCRLQDIVIPIVSAMQYLHEKRILYRDLKPSNVGFDVNGSPKLFDFGLALEIVESGRRMTPTAGSLRYMSPENALSRDYGFSTDVYSFGVLLWEVMTLEKPFVGMTRKFFYDSVVKLGARPKLDKRRVRSKAIQSLIRQCWDPSQEIRPTFTEVMKVLRSEIFT